MRLRSAFCAECPDRNNNNNSTHAHTAFTTYAGPGPLGNLLNETPVQNYATLPHHNEFIPRSTTDEPLFTANVGPRLDGSWNENTGGQQPYAPTNFPAPMLMDVTVPSLQTFTPQLDNPIPNTEPPMQ